MTRHVEPPPRNAPLGVVPRERTRIARPGPAPKRPQEPSPPCRSACARCDASFVVGLRGRRRRYCGIGCRREVEYEVRRVRRRLERDERELSRRLELDRANNGLLGTLRGIDGRTWLDDVAAIRAEISGLRRRLHVLRHPRPHPREVRRGGAALNHHGTERS